jgi:spore germination protein YaaH
MIRAWLQMMDIGGDYPIPTSEDSYNGRLSQLSTAIPTNGGKLQGDGTWLQESWKLDHEWGQTLPSIARAAGHMYTPAVSCNRDDIVSILDDPQVQEIATTNLIQLAQTRFDAPWDGVYLDIEGVPSAYKPQLSQFYRLLSYHIRSAGMTCNVWARGKVSDPGPDYDDAYANDFEVLGQIADAVEIGCYGYWKPVLTTIDRSIAPHWWQRECIEYALSRGIPACRLIVGVGLYSMYYPDSGTNAGRVQITHDAALDLIQGANSQQEWMESGPFGLVRERRADLGAGHIWLHDVDTLRHSLDLVATYELHGISLFALGMEDEYT